MKSKATTMFTKIIAIAIALATMFSLSSCEIGEDTISEILNMLFPPAVEQNPNVDPPAEETPPVEDPVCLHETEGEGSVILIDGEYYLHNVCKMCGEDVNTDVNVITFNDKWLYDETSHWNDVKCAEEAADESGVALTVTRKGNLGEHTIDESGVCTDCMYRGSSSDGLAFEINESGDGYILTGIGDCMDAHINIPAEYEGLPVVSIGAGAFNPPEEAEGISTFSLRRKPVVIGITIPDTVIYIDCTAFAKCEDLNNFIVDTANEVFTAINNCLIDTKVGSLVRGCEFSVIPEDGSVTAIGSYAFANSQGLVSITIPDSVEDIGDKAFFECDALVEVYLPENINLGVDVFRGSIHVEIKVAHTLVYVPAMEATCYEPGNIEHYICVDCGYFYADENAEERLYEVSISPSHNFEDGVCTKCGMVQDSLLIVSVDSIPDLGKFPLGTLENAIGLPTTINVRTKDGITHELDILWDLSGYDKSTVGNYIIKGVIQSGKFHYAEGLTNSIEASIEIVEFMKGTADIVFILDISGSMGDEINNVKNNIVAFSAAIEAQGVSARWSAITYSDWTVSGANEESTIIKNGTSDWFISAEEYKAAINGIDLAFGGDSPETAIDGMMLANTGLSTRQDARVFYIVLTDDACKIDNHYDVESLNQCAQILDDDKVNVSVITTTYYFSEYSVLTETTGGIQSNIYDNFSQDLLDNLVPIIYGEVIA